MKRLQAIMLAALTTPAFAGLQTVDFDGIAVPTDDPPPAAPIDDFYLSSPGVRFFLGNGSTGSSNAPTGTSAQAEANGFAQSQANVMVPLDGANDDIWVQFYNTANTSQRITVNQVGITNDLNSSGGFSRIFIEGFNSSGTSLGRTQIDGIGGVGKFTYPGIYSAKIYGASGFGGALGVDDFTFTRDLFCDANVDGAVNSLDFNALASNFGGINKDNSQGEYTGDGIVNSADFTLLAAFFGMTAAPGPVPGPALGAVVPEPSTLVSAAVLAAGASLCARRRII